MAQKNRMPVFAALLFIFCRISFAQSERSTVFNICATAQSKDSILLTWEFDQNLEKNAEYFEVSENLELKRLLIHGLLHLNGYDHGEEHIEKNKEPECEMLKIQENLLKEFEDFTIIDS